MASAQKNLFSGPVSVFQERRLPETATPAGYSALIDAYGLDVPLPRSLSAISAHHHMLERNCWRIMTPRHASSAPSNTTCPLKLASSAATMSSAAASKA